MSDKYKPVKQKSNQWHKMKTDYDRTENKIHVDEGLSELEQQILEEVQKEIQETEIKRHVRIKNVTCKICQKREEWQSTGKFPNGIRKWRDEDGLICNGRMCGKCNRDRAKGTMKKIRAQDDQYK